MAGQAKITRWASSALPDEVTIRNIMHSEGLQPYVWSNHPGDVYGAHSHGYHKVIFVVKGSIIFGLPETGDEAVLGAGDRFDLPAGVTHSAVVGREGVICLEAIADSG